MTLLFRRRQEHDIQAQFVQIFRTCTSETEVLLFSVPNECPPSWIGKLIKIGMLPGVPDIVLVWKRTGLPGVHPGHLAGADVGPGLAFLEFKDPGGDVSVAQRGVHRTLGRLGAPVAVVRSVDEAWAVVQGWGVPLRARPLFAGEAL